MDEPATIDEGDDARELRVRCECGFEVRGNRDVLGRGTSRCVTTTIPPRWCGAWPPT